MALVNGLIWGSVMGLVSFCAVSQRGHWLGDGGGDDVKLAAGGVFGRDDSRVHGKMGQRPRTRQLGVDYRVYRFGRVFDFLGAGDDILL